MPEEAIHEPAVASSSSSPGAQRLAPGVPVGPGQRLIGATRRAWRFGVRARWRSYRAPILLGIGVASLVLGTIGWLQVPLSPHHYSFLDAVYRSLTLFAFGGTAPPPVPVTLNIARIIAPLLTGYAAIGAVIALSRDQARALGIRLFARNHVIIAGLGGTGGRLAAALIDRMPVVVIDPVAANENVAGIRLRGVRTLTGSAADPAMLRRAGIENARALVAVCGSSAINVDVAAAAALATGRRAVPLTVFAHLQSLDLWTSLAGEGATFDSEHPGIRLEYFNVLAAGTQLMLERDQPFSGPDSDPHILIVGTEGVGRQIIIQLARNWRGVHPERERVLRITVAGRDARADVEDLLGRYPDLNDYCRLDTRPLPVVSAAFQRGEAMVGGDGACDVTRAYVALPDEGEGLLAALALHARSDAAAVPVTVAVADDGAGVSTVLGSDRGRFGRIEPFGVLSAATRDELLLRGTTELIARSQHAQWLARQPAPAGGKPDNPYRRPWDELDEAQRERNRRFADDLHEKLRLIGATLVPMPLPDLDSTPFTFTAEELDRLSRHEHERWMSAMLEQGWRYGPVRDDAAKRHDQIKPWEQLDEPNRDQDRDAVRELPSALARAGFAIQRRAAGPAG